MLAVNGHSIALAEVRSIFIDRTITIWQKLRACKAIHRRLKLFAGCGMRSERAKKDHPWPPLFDLQWVDPTKTKNLWKLESHLFGWHPDRIESELQLFSAVVIEHECLAAQTCATIFTHGSPTVGV